MRRSSSVWRAASRSSSAPRGVSAMTMTKADIVERIYEKVGFSKKEATEVVESIFEVGKRRLYRRKDVETLLEIRRLLYAEGYTIAGAKRRLREGARTPGTPRVRAEGATLAEVRQELTDLCRMLERHPAPPLKIE